MPRICFALLLLALLSIVLSSGLMPASPALAHGGATGIVKTRMDAMGMIGKAAKAIQLMLIGKTPYAPERIIAAAEVIKAHGGAALTRHFPKGSLQAPTEAVPAIWTEWDTFSKEAEQLAIRAGTLAGIAKTSGTDKPAIKQAFKAMMQTCSSCHMQFRDKRK